MTTTEEKASSVKKVSPRVQKYLRAERPANDKDSDWSLDSSRDLYGIKEWGNGYFDLNEKGHITVCPKSCPTNLDLLELVQDLRERGIRPPILIRFMDLIDSRVDLINQCFRKAIDEYNYDSDYKGVYPIKVNQQRHLIERMLSAGAPYQLGLECGSKPELLVALAMMSSSDGLLICNGFKDTEYVETAILSQKLGHQTIVVIEKFSDLELVMDCAERLKIKPTIGFRARLESKVSGKWAETSGPRSKFGLSATEIVKCLEILKENEMLDCIELLHFHIGSQIPSIQSIKTSLKEGARIYTELYRMGAKIQYLDVGGGLGVDYDGTGGSDSSINYSEQEYANDVVSIIQNICDEKNTPHPTIVSESGRSLTAHHSVLVFNILGTSDNSSSEEIEPLKKGDHLIMRDLYEIHENLKAKNLVEYYNDLQQLRTDITQLFSYGILNLNQRAKAETLVKTITTNMLTLAEKEEEGEIAENLGTFLQETYFANFSVFQSVPDSWAIKQTFPVLPIHRHNERPSKNGTLVDLTCDCDGKIDQFIQNSETTRSLALHKTNENEPYFLGVFLVGAYQEILGDLHNLFGDTDAVSISIDESGYHIEDVVEGDTVGEILSYIQYSRTDLTSRLRKSIEASIKKDNMTKKDARLLMRNYEEGLAGYSYLEETKDLK